MSEWTKEKLDEIRADLALIILFSSDHAAIGVHDAETRIPGHIAALLARNEELQRRVDALEKVAEAVPDVLDDGESDMDADKGMALVGTGLLLKLRDALSALDAANTPEPTPELVPVYPGPDLKRGDIVYTPSGRRAEVYNIDEDKGTFTSQGQICASVLRREKTAADTEEK